MTQKKLHGIGALGGVMSLFTRILGIISTLFFVAACGGGGGSSGGSGSASPGAPTPPDASAGGVWEGYARWGIDWYDYIGFVTESGRAYFATSGSGITSVQLSTSGNVLTGPQFAPTDHVISVLVGDPAFLSAPSSPSTLTGTLNSRVSIDARATFPYENVVIELDYQRDLHQKGSSLAAVAGTYESWWDLFEDPVDLTIRTDGTLTLHSPETGCVVNGKVSVINPSYNIYDVQYSFASCTDSLFAPLNGVSFTGLASLLPHRSDDLNPFPFLEWLATGVVREMPAGDYAVFRRKSSTSAGGVWRGSITYSDSGSSKPLDGVITSDGRIQLADGDGRQIFGRYSNEKLAVYEQDARGGFSWSFPVFGGMETPAGSVQGPVVMLATLANRERLAGTLEFYGDKGDIQKASFALSYDPEYENPASLLSLAGSYHSPGHTLNIDAAGSVLFTSTITNCVQQGFAQSADRNNVYQIDVYASNCTGNYEFLNGTISTGLAFLSTKISASDTLIYRSHTTLSNGRHVVGAWELDR